MAGEALAVNGTTQACIGVLPSRMVVYLLLAGCLFAELGYRQVWHKLTVGLGKLPVANPARNSSATWAPRTSFRTRPTLPRPSVTWFPGGRSVGRSRTRLSGSRRSPRRGRVRGIRRCRGGPAAREPRAASRHPPRESGAAELSSLAAAGKLTLRVANTPPPAWPQAHAGAAEAARMGAMTWARSANRAAMVREGWARRDSGVSGRGLSERPFPRNFLRS